jgi:hypothetical protein
MQFNRSGRLAALATGLVLVSAVSTMGAADAAAPVDSIQARPFSSSSPWNAAVSSGARFTYTSEFSGDRGWVNTGQSSFPVYYGSSSDPLLTFTTGRGTFKVHAPSSLKPASGGDASVTVVDLTNRTVTDFWQVYRKSTTTFGATGGVQTKLDGTGFGSGGVKAGVRSSGANGLGGLITGTNLKWGKIDHALAIAASSGQLSRTFKWPAVSTDSSASSNYGTLPMGTRLAIPPGTKKPALSSVGSMVWDAFARYGGYLVDRTGGFAVFAEPNTVSSGQMSPLVSDLAKIIPYLRVVS